MTKHEQRVVKRIMYNCSSPSAPGPVFDINSVPEPELVPGTPNRNLLDNEFYLAGYNYAAAAFRMRLNFLITASKEELKKYQD